MADQIGDRHLYGEVMGHLGVLDEDMLDYPRALECLEQCVQIQRELGDRHARLRALGNLGFIYLEQDELERAFDRLLDVYELSRELGDRYFMGKAIREMGRAYARRGDFSRARAGYGYQLATALDLDNQRDLGVVLGYLASAFYHLGRYAEAVRVSEQAMAQCRKLNLSYFLCGFLYDTARMHCKEGDWAAAEHLNEEALSLAARPGGRKDIALKAQLLALRVRLAVGSDGAATRLDHGERLLLQVRDQRERAAVEYELWRLDPTNDSHRQNAARLYYLLYTRTPALEYGRRYQALTGEALPAPAPLPPLPEMVLGSPLDLPALLARVEPKQQ